MTTCSKKKLLNTPATFAISALAASMVMVSPAYAAQQINQMSVEQSSNAVTQLILGFQGSPVTPVAYQLHNPERLVLDFHDVNAALSSSLQKFNKGLVNDVTIKNNGKITRMIVSLKRPGEYATAISGNNLIVAFTDTTKVNTRGSVTPIVDASVSNGSETIIEQGNDTKQTMVVRVNPLLDPMNNQVSRQYNYEGITGINVSGNGNGGSSISVGLVNESVPLDVQRQGNQLVIRMTGAKIPHNLLRRINVGGLVSSIDTKNQGRNSTITINMSGDFEYQAYQAGNSLNINVTQPKMLTEPTLEEKVYKGEPLSMEFQDVEIRSVLDVLAQFTDMNIVASDNVSGSITLRLINVPWDQALDIILKSKNLGKRENGNVILVAPAVELAEQEAKELEAQQKVKSLAPLRTEYIRLSYASAQEVFNLITQGRNSGNRNNNDDTGSLLSSRGTVTIDKRTNLLIVKDTAASLENIHALVKKIDIPVKQVMIEARIVSASDTFSKELGVKWGVLSNGAATNRNLLVGGSEDTIWDLQKYDIETMTKNGQEIRYPKYTISRPGNLNVDLGVANPAGRIAFGLLSMSDMMLDLELSAMQADNRGEVISSPKVLTADKQTAKVSSGTQIPYQEASASGATAVSFKEAALSLEVTPNITPDGKIGLQLNISNGSPTIVNGQVAIKEDAVNTNVIVEDGQTVVLGGVFKNTVANGVSKVPFLGDLPYVGRAFRNDKRTNNKEELLIFITPKLVNDGISRID